MSLDELAAGGGYSSRLGIALAKRQSVNQVARRGREVEAQPPAPTRITLRVASTSGFASSTTAPLRSTLPTRLTVRRASPTLASLGALPIGALPILDGSNTPALQSSAIFESIPREAGAALETYKQRDTTKGTACSGAARNQVRKDGADQVALLASCLQWSCGSRRRGTRL